MRLQLRTGEASARAGLGSAELSFSYRVRLSAYRTGCSAASEKTRTGAGLELAWGCGDVPGLL